MHAIEADEDIAGEAVDLFVEVSDFELGLQVHVILDVGMHAVFRGLAILAEQDEDGEEDGLKRDGEGEEAEGIRVELRNAGNIDPVHDEPESEDADVDEEKRNAAGKLRDPVRGFLHHRPFVFGFLVDVARGGVAEALDGAAVAAAHRGEQVHGGLRAELKKLFQIRPVEPERLGVLRGHDGCAARAFIEHRQLAEEIAARGDFEHDALSGVVLEKHFHLARTDDEDGVAGIAVIEDRFAGCEVDDIELCGEFRALVIVQQMEERDFFEQIGFWTHGGSNSARPAIVQGARERIRDGKPEDAMEMFANSPRTGVVSTHMIFRIRSFPISLAMLALAARAHADPLAELAAFSSFKNVNLDKLASGSVMAARGPAMSFPRGLAVESCYVVRKPLQKAVELHKEWSPLKHPELKVWLHGDLAKHSGVADFQKLRSAPPGSPVRAFVSATQKLASGGADLQLSKAEAAAYAGTPGADSGAMPEKVVNFWSNVLAQRTQAYVGGGLGRLAPYENTGEAIRPADEVARLLKDAGKIHAQFSALLDGVKGALPPTLYWEMVGVEDEAALNLGASYWKPGANTWQGVDVQYYATTGYCALLSFVQMWPVTIGGQEATLVWRGDLISSTTIGSLHGVERMGSSTAMMREMQKFVECFLNDAAKAP